MHQLMKDSILMDTETLGLNRGSGVHELAIYDLNTNALNEYLLTPNMVQVASATPQEITQLASSTLDVHKLIKSPNWIDIIKRQLVMQGHLTMAASKAEVWSTLQQTSPWLANRLSLYPHLMGRTATPNEQAKRLATLQAEGVTSFASESITPQDLLVKGGVLETAMQGKTVWLANAAFEAKQIGALTAALDEDGIVTNLKSNLQTFGPTSDPFYTTGVEVNKAKIVAQQTGDWSGVWKAYLSNTPQTGETAVRDIQDVLRAMMSYGQKLGVVDKGDVYWGTALDVTYRLMGSVDKVRGEELLKSKETHRAAEDIAQHSKYVLERALKWTEALQHVDEGTDIGKDLVAQAAQGQGDLFEAAAYLRRQQVMKTDIVQQSLVQRLVRAKTDIIEKKVTWQVDGWKSVNELTQSNPRGDVLTVPVINPNRVSMTGLDQVVNLLVSQGKYGSRDHIESQVTELEESLVGAASPEEQKLRLSSFLEKKTANVLESRIEANSDILRNTFHNDFASMLTKSKSAPKYMESLLGSMSVAKAPALLKNWGMFAGGLAIAGAAWSLVSGSSKPTRDQPSLLSYSYDEWLKRQAEFSSMRTVEEQNQGMSERGIAGTTRKQNTDFGSPYQGIIGSQAVFDQQEVYKEREKWLREQYGVVHYDPVGGLFGEHGMLSKIRHQGFSYIPAGAPVAEGYQNLRGGNLKRINLASGDWNIEVEDADTISLRRSGFLGAVSSFFGMNKQYSFRLAGIDAPEIAHGDRRAQPHADISHQALQAYFGNLKNAELVFDPDQTTYGRTMGVLFKDGKNVNYELVKRGWAGFLPFGQSDNSMIDYKVMHGMERAAASQHKGMWEQPYWQALYDSSRTYNRPTFNTLTRSDKLAENIGNLNMVSMMETADQMGMYNSAMAIEASMIGKTRHTGSDQVRPYLMQGNTAAHYQGYLNEMTSQNAQWMSNHGSKRKDKNFSRKGSYANYDKALVLDSMGNTTSIYAKRRKESFNKYGANSNEELAYDRRRSMEESQQSINKTIFNTNHLVY